MPGARRFSVSSPDWGHDHLSLDAIVAYVDDELTAGPHARAEEHLACCPDCRAEVGAQCQARTALRAAAGPRLPSSLLHNLRSIPVETELPPPPPGLGVTADGQFVLLRDVPPPPPEHPDAAASAAAPAPRRFSRRARVGAVSGLTAGALAVGAFVAPSPSTSSAPGVLGGAVLNVPVQARLSAAPAVVRPPVGGPASPADLLDGAAPPAEPTTALDARLRARLEGAPIAFHRAP